MLLVLFSALNKKAPQPYYVSELRCKGTEIISMHIFQKFSNNYWNKKSKNRHVPILTFSLYEGVLWC